MMLLAEELSDCCNSVIYFIIALKGTGEEPESLRWMDFSFSNLIVFFFFPFVFFVSFLCIYIQFLMHLCVWTTLQGFF